MAYVNETIRKFIKSGRIPAKGMVRCGFELETQSTDGLTDGDNGEDSFDEDAFHDAVSDAVDNAISSNLEARLGDAMLSRVREALYESYCETLDRSDFYSSGERALETLRDTYSTSQLEVGTDGSVDGFEFRTRGALKYSQFLFQARKIFRADHVIDEACSFHIHLSLPDVKHYYGKKFQGAMVEYIAANYDRLPETVKSRLETIDDVSYFRGLITGGSEKYAFIRYHETLNTWEFRCFGNVQNYKEAKACLDIAIEAFHYAYKVVDSGSASLISGVSASQLYDSSDWGSYVYSCFMTSKALTKARFNSYQNKLTKMRAA